jgi:hypothetical protein
VGVAEALDGVILIIVRCLAFQFGILGLGRPEVHAMGFEDGGQRLAILLGVLAEKACCLRGAGGRACAGIDVRNQGDGLSVLTASHESEAGEDQGKEKGYRVFLVACFHI